MIQGCQKFFVKLPRAHGDTYRPSSVGNDSQKSSVHRSSNQLSWSGPLGWSGASPTQEGAQGRDTAWTVCNIHVWKTGRTWLAFRPASDDSLIKTCIPPCVLQSASQHLLVLPPASKNLDISHVWFLDDGSSYPSTTSQPLWENLN